jgi:hypothetical protein
MVSITLDNLEDLPRRCRSCVFWELDPIERDRAEEAGDTAFEKESWVSSTLLEWGSCGKIAYVKDISRRGIKAIEAFGDLHWQQHGCMMPAEYLLAVGFKTVRPHPRFPRLRLDIKSTVSWREDVEYALEKLLGTMSPSNVEGALRPI